MKLGNLIALPFALIADAVSLGEAGVTRRIMQDERNERDVVSRLVDRLEWRPIESAPYKTRILIYDSTNDWYEVSFLDERGFWYSDKFKIEPTHWLPLPPIGDK